MRLGFQLSKLTFDSLRCGMWYQRIMETRDEGIFDSNPIEIPSIRRWHEDVEVDDDPAHFRRVRLKCCYSPPPLPPPRYIFDLSAGIYPGEGWQNGPSNLIPRLCSSSINGSERQSEPFQYRITSLSPQLGHAKKEPMQKRRVYLIANGRVHAIKVGRAEACSDCRRQHALCIHKLPEDLG